MSHRLVLVRHGQAAAGWGDATDPGLDEVGRAQAEAAAEALAPIGPLPIVVSPLRRTRETAAPLEARFGVPARVELAVGEIAWPGGDDADRVGWLVSVMASRWPELGAELAAWRRRVVDALLGLGEPTVVVTHFVAINVAVGEATGDDRVVCFSPANCSRTVLEVDDGRLRLVELGAEAPTVPLVGRGPAEASPGPRAPGGVGP